MILRILRKDSEEKLIRDCQQGNPAAQRDLYNKYSRKMLGICQRYVNRQADAEDIMIEGFMRVFDKIGQFKSEGSFEGWVRRIMVNEALGYIRKNKSFLSVDAEDVHNEPAAAWTVMSWQRRTCCNSCRSSRKGTARSLTCLPLKDIRTKKAGFVGIMVFSSIREIRRAGDLLEK